MPTRRRRYPLINELNEHRLQYEQYMDESRTADDRYALERASLVAQGARCTYVIDTLRKCMNKHRPTPQNTE